MPVKIVRCDHCGCELIELRGRNLILRARHHGELHVSVVPLAVIVALAEYATLDNDMPMRYTGSDQQGK